MTANRDLERRRARYGRSLWIGLGATWTVCIGLMVAASAAAEAFGGGVLMAGLRGLTGGAFLFAVFMSARVPAMLRQEEREYVQREGADLVARWWAIHEEMHALRDDDTREGKATWRGLGRELADVERSLGRTTVRDLDEQLSERRQREVAR